MRRRKDSGEGHVLSGHVPVGEERWSRNRNWAPRDVVMCVVLSVMGKVTNLFFSIVYSKEIPLSVV